MALVNRRLLWQRRTTDRRQATAHKCNLGTCMNRSSRNQGTTWRGRANQTWKEKEATLDHRFHETGLMHGIHLASEAL
jgi:hypothetical protein